MARNNTLFMFATVFIVLITVGVTYYYIMYKRPSVQLEAFADLGNTLYMNQSMDPFDALTSANILYKMVYQDDGNLAIVKVSTGKELWSTATKTKDVRPGKAIMSHDGNLILYDANSKIYWTSSTNNKGVGPFRLELQNDGSASIFDSRNAKQWSTSDKI